MPPEQRPAAGLREAAEQARKENSSKARDHNSIIIHPILKVQKANAKGVKP
jgi:hypothetical protein